MQQTCWDCKYYKYKNKSAYEEERKIAENCALTGKRHFHFEKICEHFVLDEAIPKEIEESYRKKGWL